MPLASCPPSFKLEQFLLGQLEGVDSETFESHVSSCVHCQQQMNTLVAEDDFVRAIRASSTHSTVGSAPQLIEAPEELVRLLTPHFKRIATLSEETGSFDFCAIDKEADFQTAGFLESKTARCQDSDAIACISRIGHYEIRGTLGQGGMGTVLHAYDPALKRAIAIKVIHAKLVANPAMASRLVREAQAAAAVEHDNIVAVYAVETHDGAPCIMMPLLRGKSLKQRLEEQPGPLALVEILRIGKETATGLAAAHAVGLTHCDIKPANLWLEAPQARVKILDFGLAIVREGNETDGENESDVICGTPGYLAPEQARGLPLDPRTDIFSLGCVLYRMATGLAPFAGERRLRALWTVLADTPATAAQVNPQVPRDLSDLITQMLSREPDQRPASATVIVETLAAIENRLVEQQHKAIRSRWLAAMLLVALLSGSGVGVWAMLNRLPADMPVKMTFSGDEPPIEVLVSHQGQEQRLTLGREKTIELLPGQYTLRPVADHPGRTLVPDHFSVETNSPQMLRIAFVGEIANHATHTQPVTSIGVLPGENQRIYSAGLDRVIAAWDTESSHAPSFADLPHAVRCIALSPRGDRIATAGGNKQIPAELEIRILTGHTLDLFGEPLSGHSRLVTALSYSPDGTHLASAGADGLMIWDLNRHVSQTLEQSEPQAIFSLAYSSDGNQLLSGDGQGQVVLWDLRERTARTKIAASELAIRTVAFVQNRLIASGDDGVIRIWQDGVLKQEWLGNTKPVLALAVSPNGRQVVSGDAGGTIRVWSVSHGQSMELQTIGTGAVNAIALTANGRQAVTGGIDGVVRLWQLPFSD